MRCTKEVLITSDSAAEAWSAACWDPLTGSVLTTYKNATALGNHCVSILKDSYLLAADVTKPRLHLWPLNSQSPVANLRLMTPGKVSALSCSHNGCYIIAAIGEKIFVWQTSTGRLLRVVSKHYQTITCLKFTQDGSHFASGGEDGLVFLWSLVNIANNDDDTASKYGYSDHTLPVKDIYVGNFGTRARLISVSLDRTARIYDVISGTKLLTLIFRVPLTSVCMDINECNLFVGCSDGNIRQFSLQTPPRNNEFHVPDEKNSIVFKGHTGNVTCLSISVDCITLLSGSTDGNVNLWDIPSRQIIRTIPHKGPITTAMFAPAHANYRAAVFKPTILVRPLQRITEESSKDEIIEIATPYDNSCDLLDIKTYLEENVDNVKVDDDLMENITEDPLEIDRLRKINKEMYKHLVDHLMNTKTGTTNSNMES